MILDENKPQPLKVDELAPETLIMQIIDPIEKTVLFEETAKLKHFSTGSVGYFVGGKMTNPESGERYQVGCNISLIGSKPK